MPIERHFLGWDAPCLPKAVEWLRAQYATGDRWDMSGVLAVVPTARAARRLLELLVQAAGDTLLFPPEIITPGDLPERLYTPGTPAKPTADHLHAMLARVHALRYADEQVLRRVVPQLPHFDDITGWLALARDLEEVYEDLAAEAVPTAEVPQRCAAVDDFADESRWEAFHVLEQGFERVLAEHGLLSCHQARFEALRTNRCRADREIVLIGTADLRRITGLMLERAGGSIAALIHAPESEADAFDALGCLIPDAWATRRIDLDRELIHVVGRPRDQARQVLDALVGESDGNLLAHYPPDRITIGIGDDTLGPIIERTLDIADVPTRPAAGRSLLQTRTSALLFGLARYLKRQRFDDFAALLRHCDVEDFLLRTLPLPLREGPGEGSSSLGLAQPLAAAEAPKEPSPNPSLGGRGEGIADWLTLLDRYLTDHLQGRLAQTWLGDASGAAEVCVRHGEIARTRGLPEDTPAAGLERRDRAGRPPRLRAEGFRAGERRRRADRRRDGAPRRGVVGTRRARRRRRDDAEGVVRRRHPVHALAPRQRTRGASRSIRQR
jgi:hypothetical protein